MKIFGERLSELRNEQNLSMTQLAKALGIGVNTISRWERAEQIPNIDYLVKVAKFFHVSCDYLCGMED